MQKYNKFFSLKRSNCQLGFIFLHMFMKMFYFSKRRHMMIDQYIDVACNYKILQFRGSKAFIKRVREIKWRCT